jgi:hypothetical protein
LYRVLLYIHVGICVVDLDTVMPGQLLSDLGDLLRTSLCAHSEEETDLSLVQVREDFFHAVLRGYLTHTRDLLCAAEKSSLVYSGAYIIYTQAIRFLTDYLLGDVYYRVKDSWHNYHRAANQLQLLQSYREKTEVFEDIARQLITDNDS